LFTDGHQSFQRIDKDSVHQPDFC